jgi:hypothetical protein
MLAKGARPNPPVSSAQIAEDVPEQVRSHDNRVPASSAYQVHGHGVNVYGFARDLFILGTDGFKHPPPEGSGEGQDIGLVHERHERPVIAARMLESRPHDTLQAAVGLHRFLYRHLLLCPCLEGSPEVHVEALRILPEDLQVDPLGRDRLQGARAGSRRTQVR